MEGDRVSKIESRHLLRCPIDRGALDWATSKTSCLTCGAVFPITSDVPILINDANSVFHREDFVKENSYGGAGDYGGSLDRSSGVRKSYREFVSRLKQAPVIGPDIDPIKRVIAITPEARILVVGSGDRQYDGNVIYTDVALSPRILCVCDTHDLPFPEAAFDAVIADSVLEHVCDPSRCVAEFVRVLKPGGFIYAVTPFLQPVHMGAYDFSRFTYLGHRRLFRNFDDIESGMCGGPAYAFQHFIRHAPEYLVKNRVARKVLSLFALLISRQLKHLDGFLTTREASYNSASATYFFGRLRTLPMSDRELLGLFRGM